ncbi:hypothetical protein [Streptomyces sp. NPDC049887]|uniref:hypothetical protein n=1 Tax=Streptomyces sp. NPDC049887 TaxID=3155654 RepID=UPI003435883A
MGTAGKKITERLSGQALHQATGKDWDGWFALLDSWGATGHDHAAIARHLVGAHGVPGWYAQSITVGYEQERGMRAVGQGSGGGWQASGSRTVGVPARLVNPWFADDALRPRWLPEGEFTLRTHRPGRSVTADWDGGASRIAVHLTARSEQRTRIGLSHTGLPDGDAVAAYKAFWKERLADLKELLES